MELSITGYDVKEKIGEGGMAQVYSARHQRLERDVALKIMLSRFSDDKMFSERFIREARIAANLSHPHIVQIFDVDEIDGKLFLSMELVTGGDLSKHLKHSRDKNAALQIFGQLCDALDYAHAKGYIHRDIKPANILFRENGSLALSDFGIARAMHSDTHMTQTGVVVGTPSYMSPEQAQGAELTGQSDLYSVGVMAFQYVTGQLPYQADSSITVAIKHINEPIPTLPKNLEKLQPFFNKALAKKPEARHQNGREFIEDFAQHLNKIKDINPDQGSTIVQPEHSAHNDKTETAQRSYITPHHQLASDYLPRPQQSPATEATTLAIVFMQINRFKVFVQRRTPFALLLLLVLSVGGAGYFASKAGFLENNTPALSPGEKIRLEQLIVAADLALRDDRLTTPENDNAFDHFNEILKLSPNDPVALDGIQSVKSQLIKKAQALFQIEKIDGIAGIISQLKRVDSEAPEVIQLEKQFSYLKNARQTRLTEGLLLAQKIEKQEGLPVALEHYQRLIPLETEKKEVTLVIQNIVDTKINQSNIYINNKAYSDAITELALAQHVAEIFEDAQRLEKIDQLMSDANEGAEKTKTSTTLNRLLASGDNALKKGNWDRPALKNAWYYYTQALKLSPGNQRAKSGLAKVASRMVAQTKKETAQGNVKKAHDYINRLSQLDPTNRELPSLRTELEAKKLSLQKQKELNARVADLYARADKYLKAKRPNRADKVYRQIARISPDDPVLKKLGPRIADGYVYLAQREIDARDWRDVDVWVKKGLVHVPNHQRLLEQRAYAEEKMRR